LVEPESLQGSILVHLLGPAAVLFVGVGAWCIQVWISKKRATIEFISQNEIGNTLWQEATRRFAKLSREDGLTPLAAEDLDDERLKDRLLVGYMLTHCEAVAVAIKRGVINKKIYKDWNRSRYADAWNKAQGYIGARRAQTDQSTAFEHFEELARKWGAGSPPSP